MATRPASAPLPELRGQHECWGWGWGGGTRGPSPEAWATWATTSSKQRPLRRRPTCDDEVPHYHAQRHILVQHGHKEGGHSGGRRAHGGVDRDGRRDLREAHPGAQDRVGAAGVEACGAGRVARRARWCRAGKRAGQCGCAAVPLAPAPSGQLTPCLPRSRPPTRHAPYQPNQRRKTPRRVREALWPGMSTGLPAASKRPMRGPRTRAAARLANPPTMCTGPSPAKSYTPLLKSRV